MHILAKKLDLCNNAPFGLMTRIHCRVNLICDMLSVKEPLSCPCKEMTWSKRSFPSITAGSIYKDTDFEWKHVVICKFCSILLFLYVPILAPELRGLCSPHLHAEGSMHPPKSRRGGYYLCGMLPIQPQSFRSSSQSEAVLICTVSPSVCGTRCDSCSLPLVCGRSAQTTPTPAEKETFVEFPLLHVGNAVCCTGLWAVLLSYQLNVNVIVSFSLIAGSTRERTSRAVSFGADSKRTGGRTWGGTLCLLGQLLEFVLVGYLATITQSWLRFFCVGIQYLWHTLI